jgi:hypothetical protein
LVTVTWVPHELAAGSAEASQSSFLLENQILMVGGLSASAHGGIDANASSLLHVFFSLTTDSLYSSNFIAGPDVSTYAEFVRYGPFGQPIEGYGLISNGLLPAGHYKLAIEVGAAVVGHDGSSGGSYNYGLILSPLPEIPEPSTAVIAMFSILFRCTSRRRAHLCR